MHAVETTTRGVTMYSHLYLTDVRFQNKPRPYMPRLKVSRTQIYKIPTSVHICMLSTAVRE